VESMHPMVGSPRNVENERFRHFISSHLISEGWTGGPRDNRDPRRRTLQQSEAVTIPPLGTDASTALLERARDRLELLSAAGERLSGSLQPQAIAQAMAALVVPRLADWCRIDLLDAHGRLEQVVMHHQDPARRAEAEQAARDFRASADAEGSMDWCIRQGRSHLQQADSAEALAAQSAPELMDVTRRFGFNACFVTPLVARGRTLGAFAVMQAESCRGFDPEDVALVAELGRRAALALDNARLFAEADAARREAEAANRAKDEFLALLGHELRNPLAPIATALQLMAMRGDASFASERALIERQVAHLARLVDDLLDVARITRGDLRLQLERVALRARRAACRARGGGGDGWARGGDSPASAAGESAAGRPGL
jgi:K+-sensing histidine kinase KdpD